MSYFRSPKGIVKKILFTERGMATYLVRANHWCENFLKQGINLKIVVKRVGIVRQKQWKVAFCRCTRFRWAERGDIHQLIASGKKTQKICRTIEKVETWARLSFISLSFFQIGRVLDCYWPPQVHLVHCSLPSYATKFYLRRRYILSLHFPADMSPLHYSCSTVVPPNFGTMLRIITFNANRFHNDSIWP